MIEYSSSPRLLIRNESKTTMLDLSHLNPQQKLAVETTEGPVLVLAGAGSGKTSVLTHRIAFILDAGLAGPQNILSMTFTNKAAGEMRERIEKLLKENESISNLSLGSKFSMPWMGTFHSICVRILKIHGEHIGLDRNFSIYDSSDQLSAIKEAMKKLDISVKEFNPNSIKSYISSAKNQLINHEDYRSYAQGYFQQVVAKVYSEYQGILKEANSVDFDDLIMYTIQLLEKENRIKDNFQKQFRYILVDEYQDTNPAQYQLVQLLTNEDKNICVVGDDDQSIYSFRGATIKNILSFEKDYPKCTVIKLEQNYRSTKTILEASYQVISKNKARKDKKLWTDKQDGEQITVYRALDEGDEGRWIIQQMDTIKEANNLSWNDFAILYRTNAQSRSLEESFINMGVPYRIVGGVRFYERKEIKDVLAYLKFIYNPRDSKNLERIVNVPRRGIGNKTYQDSVRKAKAFDLTLGEFIFQTSHTTDNPKMDKFIELMRRVAVKKANLDVVDLVNYILEVTGYIEMLDDGTSDNADRIENIRELVSVASRFTNLEPEASLEAFLDEVSLLEGIAESKESEKSVTLMTIHSAKGLEFPYVFVVGMEENIFPHSNSMFDEKELEEERRLAYVAITRAKNKLFLTHASSRMFFGKTNSNPPSRFLEDIEPDLVDRQINDRLTGSYEPSSSFRDDYSDDYKINIDLEVGDRVKHEYFGVGKVKYMDDELIEVDFGPTYGVKELMLEYASLEKV